MALREVVASAAWSLAFGLGLCACGSGATERCEPHEELEGQKCESVCADGEKLLANGRCEPLCESGEVVVAGRCEPQCPSGQEYVAGSCETACAAEEQRVDAVCRAPSAVRVDSVGYPTGSEKIAVISGEPGAVVLRSYPDGEEITELDAAPPVMDVGLGLELTRVDFSEVTTPGRYQLHTAASGDSAPFTISDSPYEDALHSAMLGFYGLRCGSKVDFEYAGDVFAHEACHEQDAYEAVGSATKVVSVGGWHDAGDYGKYTQNGAFAAGILLLAWEHFEDALGALDIDEIPEAGGDVPDFLDEVRYELDWLLTMQREDGATYHKLTALNFEGFIMPQSDTSARYMAPVSTEATGSFVAVMARASRAYRPFDAEFADRCLAAAERGYAYLNENPEHVSPDLSAFSTGGYKSDDHDDRAWANVEMWLSTGESTALAQFESEVSSPEVGDDWDWGGLWNLAWFSYALAPEGDADPALKAAVAAAVVASAERLSDGAESDSFFRALGSTYYWGANGLVARSIMNLSAAHRLTADDRYKSVALAQLHHLFGVNVQGRSFVTGLGFLPPRLPHHRPSGADIVEAPWPGLLVGGPNPQTPRDDATALSIVDDPDAPAPFLWQDHQASYWTNEVAVNWNAPLVYGLAWFQN